MAANKSEILIRDNGEKHPFSEYPFPSFTMFLYASCLLDVMLHLKLCLITQTETFNELHKDFSYFNEKMILGLVSLQVRTNIADTL